MKLTRPGEGVTTNTRPQTKTQNSDATFDRLLRQIYVDIFLAANPHGTETFSIQTNQSHISKTKQLSSINFQPPLFPHHTPIFTD